MKRASDIKKFFKNASIDTKPQMDQQVFDKVLTAHERSKNAKSASLQTNIWKRVFQNRITKLAAAAVIIVAVSFFFIYQGPNGQKDIPEIVQAVDSPAELTTLASLSFAYRQGGIEMVEKVFDQALKQAGQRPANISTKEFFLEINNTKSERTKL